MGTETMNDRRHSMHGKQNANKRENEESNAINK